MADEEQQQQSTSEQQQEARPLSPQLDATTAAAEAVEPSAADEPLQPHHKDSQRLSTMTHSPHQQVKSQVTSTPHLPPTAFVDDSSEGRRDRGGRTDRSYL